MAKDYSALSRIAYANYEDIEAAITAGKLNANDIVFCKDTHEVILIKDDLSYYPLQSKTYVFDSEDDALDALNTATDTYEGQIVSIKGTSGAYGTYVVNKSGDQFQVVSVASSSISFDYNQAFHKPVTNVVGDSFDPAIIADLSNGVYRVTGTYKVAGSSVESVTTTGGHVAIIETVGSVKYIRLITAQRIYDYAVATDGTITGTYVVTKEWLDDHSYATQTYVDRVIADVVESEIENTLTTSFIEATDTELQELFN